MVSDHWSARWSKGGGGRARREPPPPEAATAGSRRNKLYANVRLIRPAAPAIDSGGCPVSVRPDTLLLGESTLDGQSGRSTGRDHAGLDCGLPLFFFRTSSQACHRPIRVSVASGSRVSPGTSVSSGPSILLSLVSLSFSPSPLPPPASPLPHLSPPAPSAFWIHCSNSFARTFKLFRLTCGA